MPTELQRLRAIRESARRDLAAIVVKREREQAQHLVDSSGRDFPALVCECGAALPSTTPVVPGRPAPLCRGCELAARTLNTTESGR